MNTLTGNDKKMAIVRAEDAMSMAKAIEGACRTEKGVRGVHFWRGEFWVWEGSGWAKMDQETMKRRLWLELGKLRMVEEDANKGTRTESPVVPTRNMVAGVGEALAAVTELEAEKMPVWLGEGTGPFKNADMVVACKDVLVDVLESVKQGQLVMVDRDERWLDPLSVKVNLKGAEKSVEWDERCKEWGEGEEAWQDLLERWMGYTLLGTRGYQRAMLQIGRSGSGKGTVTRVWGRLCGGQNLVGATWDDFAGGFGMDGLESAKLLVVTEGGEDTGKMVKGRGGTVLKVLVGEDPITVNKKYGAKLTGVRSPAAVMIQANGTPNLADGGGGISGKMLVLPYRVGRRGTEDVSVEEKLVGQGAGVVRAWVEGAIRLVGAQGGRWPVVDGAKGEVDELRGSGGMLDSWMEDCFVRASDGFVSGDEVRRVRKLWERRTGCKLEYGDKGLLTGVARDAKWDVREGRLGSGGPRGLRGLRLKG